MAITQKELKAIRKAARNIKTEYDTFYITNGMFNCRWNGETFVWTYPSGKLTDNLDIRQLLKRIPTKPYGNKRDITTYCFDFGNDNMTEGYNDDN